MRLENFKFLTDENIDPAFVQYLRNLNFKIIDVKEEGLFKSADSFLLNFSAENHLVIITLDSDFGTLIHRDKLKFLGIIYLRPGHFSTQHHIETFSAVLKANIKLKTPFMIIAEWQESGVKIRVKNNLIL